MKLWGEAAEGRPSLLKSFQNIYGILRESLGTFVQSWGKLSEIPWGHFGTILATIWSSWVPFGRHFARLWHLSGSFGSKVGPGC